MTVAELVRVRKKPGPKSYDFGYGGEAALLKFPADFGHISLS
jgi:hypothetical protein